MFNLEQAIADWRRRMSASGIKSPTPLDELESHLRDEIEQQMKSGLNEQESFNSAIQKTGELPALKTEFAKVGDVGKVSKWERWLAVVISAGVVIPLGTYALLKYEMSLGWRLVGFVNFAVIALSILSWRYINKSFPVIPDKRVRTAIGLAFGFLGMVGLVVFMKFILPNFSFTEGQLTVVVLWSLTLMAALGTVSAGLEEAARRQSPTAVS